MKNRKLTTALGAAALFAVVVALPEQVSAGGGGCHNPQRTEGSGTTVRLTEAHCFEPHVLYIEPGEEVEFVSKAQVDHNIHGLDWGTFEFDRETSKLPPGQTYSRLFEEAGYYPYACTLHFGMLGVIVVGELDGTAEPTTQAIATDEDGGMSPGSVALFSAAGALALGMVGGGAYLRRRGHR